MVLLGVAAVIGGVLVAPFLYPYWQARQQQGLVRPLREVTKYSATWLDYLTSTGRLHAATPLRAVYFMPPPHDVLFPGLTATALALVAVATGLAWRDRRARMLAAIGIAGVRAVARARDRALSLGLRPRAAPAGDPRAVTLRHPRAGRDRGPRRASGSRGCSSGSTGGGAGRGSSRRCSSWPP